MRVPYLIAVGIAAAASPLLHTVLGSNASPSATHPLAGPPTQIVAHWSDSLGCVTATRWADDIEDLVKQTLPNEMFAGSDHMEALKANASIIRQDSWWWFIHKESTQPIGYCGGVAPYAYHWRDSRMEFISGTGHSRTNAATNATYGKGWQKPTGSPDTLEDPDPQKFISMRFNDCVQLDSNAQANAGWAWSEIVGRNTYPPGQYAPGKPCAVPVLAPLSFVTLYK